MREPSWLAWARTQIGVREVPGASSNSRILRYADKAKRFLGIAFNSDGTPWCGVFVAAAMVDAGYDPPLIAVRARSWAAWGQPITPRLGAVLVFVRSGGGHVGFYTGETETHFRVLGGNQADAVNEMFIEKARCIAVRWPRAAPDAFAPVRLPGVGSVPVSVNES